jgi:hypothetical protein
MNLIQLGKLARQELAQLNFPPANWVPPAPGPDGQPLLDALGAAVAARRSTQGVGA